MGTVRDAWLNFAAESGIDPDEYVRVRLNEVIGPGVPDRYRYLVTDVLWRLPEGWDAARTWVVEVSDHPKPGAYASADRLEEFDGEIEQLWTVTLYPALLDQLSDPACRYVIAHEFGHVASGLPVGSIMIKGKWFTKIKGTTDQYEKVPTSEDHEDVAEKIAMEWGFSGELTTLFKDENEQST